MSRHHFKFKNVGFLFFFFSLVLQGRMSEDRIVLGGFDRAEARLKAVRHLVLTACGTSLYASMYGAKIMRDLEALDTATVRGRYHGPSYSDYGYHERRYLNDGYHGHGYLSIVAIAYK